MFNELLPIQNNRQSGALFVWNELDQYHVYFGTIPLGAINELFLWYNDFRVHVLPAVYYYYPSITARYNWDSMCVISHHNKAPPQTSKAFGSTCTCHLLCILTRNFWNSPCTLSDDRTRTGEVLSIRGE